MFEVVQFFDVQDISDLTPLIDGAKLTPTNQAKRQGDSFGGSEVSHGRPSTGKKDEPYGTIHSFSVSAEPQQAVRHVLKDVCLV